MNLEKKKKKKRKKKKKYGMWQKTKDLMYKHQDYYHYSTAKEDATYRTIMGLLHILLFSR